MGKFVGTMARKIGGTNGRKRVRKMIRKAVGKSDTKRDKKMSECVSCPPILSNKQGDMKGYLKGGKKVIRKGAYER